MRKYGPIRRGVSRIVRGTVQNSGYSLVEIMVVLVMIAVIVAILTPQIGRTFRQTSTRVAADEFVSTHALARSLAQRYGRVAELHIDVVEGRLRVEVDTGAIPGVAPRVSVVRYMAEGKVNIASDRSVLCFDVRGLPATQGTCQPADATVVFSLPGEADTVRFSVLGEALR
jgi:prepilin-type N-terminal cleavage/methylation domain-containing protein